MRRIVAFPFEAQVAPAPPTRATRGTLPPCSWTKACSASESRSPPSTKWNRMARISSPSLPHMSTPRVAMLDEGACRTQSTAHCSDEHNHCGSMKAEEQCVASSVASLEGNRKIGGEERNEVGLAPAAVFFLPRATRTVRFDRTADDDAELRAGLQALMDHFRP